MTDDNAARPRAGVAGARAWLWWAMLVVPLWAVLIVGVAWEPVMRDGWGHIVWYRDRWAGIGSIYDFARECYLIHNPRLGQVATLVMYVPGPHHAIATPLVELAVFALLTALALGRWPSPRRSDDAVAAALIVAVLWACVPQLGPMLFYRPFTWNYLFGLGLNLWWLVPYRLELTEPRPVRWWRAPLAFVLGVAAGLCNEHTGVAFAAMAALATAIAWRRGGLRAWMITGLVGLCAGYAVLLTAPAQHVRYGALAEQAGVVARIAGRGVRGNLEVLGGLALALAPALVLVAIGLVQRRAAPSPATPISHASQASQVAGIERASPAVLALGGLACTVTLLASPKLGPRLYFASIALIAAGLVGWLVGRLTAGRARRGWATDPTGEDPRPAGEAVGVPTPRVRRSPIAVAGLAAAVLVFVDVRLIAVQRVIGPIGEARRERIEHGPPGAVVTVPRFPVVASRYFLGEDLDAAAARAVIASDYRLTAIELAPR